ncbi:uncharacterized protein LOC128339766 isoform X3 [Hemicordylus capensis]|uniref:uncharacterized protein LOC128339766 isoform X3 n=2 Tax=Hemicordylus capensis TaxID=884348 RepID=UPI002304B37A|nr:uncharacterized protein LOC128339766 isoform X3 [Hemicordylus capensis]XP_053140149.1 uncharacterized protein LOC128339766 isoform X3 [Hemicordylus capensis]XP_053140150.1 uncharacterized protein LOC128339766 isoform X3 [Hemicordylus capensis]XP_053140151.1 uncharacterized protein LOC128339766 isoform X3 [Hemicordylus capensis]XP_053140152.1 uncharacterized protein LOC128339766 isoform X3 [Hemicordylus capensis]XP_053140153.1 uncharacterized protein LOC128339766 isoform X3 [Hemicordylus cap
MAAHPKSWHLIACCRKPRDHQDPERQGSFGISTPSAAPRTKWYHLCRRREAFAVKDGRDAHKNRQSSRAFGNQSGDSLVSSMHCTLISSDESELEDLKLGEELMVDRSTQMVWEDLSDTERQSSRALGNQSGDSSVSSMHCSLFSSSSYQSEVEDCKVDEELIKIIHRHMEDREEVVMEKSPVQSGPTILLLYAMAAVSRLSKIKPPTDPELESAILHFAVRGLITVQAGNVHKQALHKLAADNLELMLRGFLSEAPTTQHLLSLLEQVGGP